MEERDHNGVGKECVNRENLSWILEMRGQESGVPDRGTGVEKGKSMVDTGYSDKSRGKRLLSGTGLAKL